MPRTMTLPPTTALSAPSMPLVDPTRIYWSENGVACSALWRSERGAAAPKRVVLADDTTTADAAYRMASEGTAMLWRGDYHNARQLLQAMARRADKSAVRKKSRAGLPASGASAFHTYRQAKSQRARLLGMVLLNFDADYHVDLRRAPQVKSACEDAWGLVTTLSTASVASLRELLGLISAREWRTKGVDIAALGVPGHNRIHPHYGVFSPIRGEYLELVASTPLPGHQPLLAFDIGTGTGVLAAILARRGVSRVVATELNPRALACAQANVNQLGVDDCVDIVQADLYPPGQADLIVCNPPWLPARPGSPLELAVYDEGSRMLLGFLVQLAAHLRPQGEGWLILSDLAEHLGLRTRAELLDAFAANGLVVLSRHDTKPVHGKAFDTSDTLHNARSQEITSLWRLGQAHAVTSTSVPVT